MRLRKVCCVYSQSRVMTSNTPESSCLAATFCSVTTLARQGTPPLAGQPPSENGVHRGWASGICTCMVLSISSVPLSAEASKPYFQAGLNAPRVPECPNLATYVRDDMACVAGSCMCNAMSNPANRGKTPRFAEHNVRIFYFLERLHPAYSRLHLGHGDRDKDLRIASVRFRPGRKQTARGQQGSAVPGWDVLGLVGTRKHCCRDTKYCTKKQYFAILPLWGRIAPRTAGQNADSAVRAGSVPGREIGALAEYT